MSPMRRNAVAARRLQRRARALCAGAPSWPMPAPFAMPVSPVPPVKPVPAATGRARAAGPLAAAASLLLASAAALAQPALPNPLIRPTPAAPGAAAAPGGAGALPAVPVPGPERGSLRGGPLPVDGLDGGRGGSGSGSAPPSIPYAVQERVANLYVAAIVDRAAVLRSQLAVPQVVFSSGAANAAAPQGAGGAEGQPAAMPGLPAPGGAQQGGGQAPGASVFRSPAYVVRDGQVVDFIDVHRVLSRVTRDTVVLYLLPEGDEKRAKVIFRGSIDSVIAAPPVPPRTALETPGGGTDGSAWRELTDIRRGGNEGNRNGTTGGTGQGNAAGTGNRAP